MTIPKKYKRRFCGMLVYLGIVALLIFAVESGTFNFLLK